MQLKEAVKWLHNARDRLFAAIHVRNEMKREKGESWAHWRARRKKAAERVQHREEIKDRLAKKVEFLRDKKDKQTPSGPVAQPKAPWNPYNREIAGWIVPWLHKSWEAGWRGAVNSGWRSPAYSTQLCMNMCGAPSCPGKCAGAASNHSGSNYPAGAIDVSDYDNFERIQFRIGSPLRNALPYDPVHFSISGR